MFKAFRKHLTFFMFDNFSALQILLSALILLPLLFWTNPTMSAVGVCALWFVSEFAIRLVLGKYYLVASGTAVVSLLLFVGPEIMKILFKRQGAPIEEICDSLIDAISGTAVFRDAETAYWSGQAIFSDGVLSARIKKEFERRRDVASGKSVVQNDDEITFLIACLGTNTATNVEALYVFGEFLRKDHPSLYRLASIATESDVVTDGSQLIGDRIYFKYQEKYYSAPINDANCSAYPSGEQPLSHKISILTESPDNAGSVAAFIIELCLSANKEEQNAKC